MVVVRVDTRRIRDWASFHDVFAELFGFPDFYGRNMDAWNDCMYWLDAPETPMTTVFAPPGGVVLIQLDHFAYFVKHCPEQYAALVECTAWVNWLKLEEGKPPVLALSFDSRG
jgi:hypothetical protein